MLIFAVVGYLLDTRVSIPSCGASRELWMAHSGVQKEINDAANFRHLTFSYDFQQLMNFPPKYAKMWTILAAAKLGVFKVGT